jgi:hypothetical protein
MNQLDDAIREALANDPDLAKANLQDPGLMEMFHATFRSSMRWWAIMVMIEIFVLTGIAVTVAIQFFSAEDTKQQILWATLFIFSGLAIMMLKLWWWNLMDRLAITREIKRLELRIAHLNGKKAD